MRQIRGMALALFVLHDDLVGAMPKSAIQELALRAGHVAARTFLSDIRAEADTLVSFPQFAEWMQTAPKSSHTLWLHLIDLPAGAE
jgi:hypothetical protein